MDNKSLTINSEMQLSLRQTILCHRAVTNCNNGFNMAEKGIENGTLYLDRRGSLREY